MFYNKYILIYKDIHVSCWSFLLYNRYRGETNMRILSGLNHQEKLHYIIQECITLAKEHPFENYIFITEQKQYIEDIFLQYTHILVNIEIMTWQQYLQQLQLTQHLNNYSLATQTQMTYALQHIFRHHQFSCFQTQQPYPLIQKLIPLMKELELSQTSFTPIPHQEKLNELQDIYQLLNQQLPLHTSITRENILKDCTFNEQHHLYIEGDHLYQPLRQTLIQKLAEKQSVTILYTYHQDERLFNLPYQALCQEANEMGSSHFLSDHLFLQSVQHLSDDVPFYQFHEASIQEEVHRVVYTIYQKIADENLKYQDFAIVYPDTSYIDILHQTLKEKAIPHDLVYATSCQYDPSYQYIIQRIHDYDTIPLNEFARIMAKEVNEASYHDYLESLYHFDDIFNQDELREFFKMTYTLHHHEKHQGKDCLQIASLEQFNTAFPKHIFFLGFNETVVPRLIKDTSLLLDEDITYLRTQHISTPLTTLEQLGLCQNQILKALQQPYLSMTFSYHLSTLSGETCLPSSLFKQLTSMYSIMDLPQHQYVSLHDFYLKGGQIHSLQINQCIHDYLGSKNQPHNIDPQLVKQLYSPTLSVSQIETYNKCPFLYFIQYGLGIYPLKENKLLPNELGSLVHYILSLNIDTQTKINQLVDKYIQQDENLSSKIQASRINQYFIQQLKKDLHFTIQILKQFLNISTFDIDAQEEKIEDTIHGLKFKGFVDRIDTDQDYISIIDYKSSSKDIDLNLAMQGFNIQMLLYLKMVTKKYNKDAGAVLYFNTKRRVLTTNEKLDADINQNDIYDLYRYGGYVIDDDSHHMIKALDPDMERKSHIIQVNYVKSKDQYKGHLLSQQQLQLLFEEIESHILKLYQTMISGNIMIAPKGSDQSTTHTQVNPCRYCPYQSVCQFDVFYNDYALVEFLNVEEKLGGEDNAI